VIQPWSGSHRKLCFHQYFQCGAWAAALQRLLSKQTQNTLHITNSFFHARISNLSNMSPTELTTHKIHYASHTFITVNSIIFTSTHLRTRFPIASTSGHDCPVFVVVQNIESRKDAHFITLHVASSTNSRVHLHTSYHMPLTPILRKKALYKPRLRSSGFWECTPVNTHRHFGKICGLCFLGSTAYNIFTILCNVLQSICLHVTLFTACLAGAHCLSSILFYT
jgi:hypothetical protein